MGNHSLTTKPPLQTTNWRDADVFGEEDAIVVVQSSELAGLGLHL